MLMVNQLVGFGAVSATPFGAVTDIMPTMTSDTAPSGVTSASSVLAGGYDAWDAAADNVSDDDHLKCWITNSTTTGWWQYQHTGPVGIGGWSARVGAGAAYISARMLKDGTLKASTTGAWGGEEVTLDTFTGLSFTDGERKTRTFVNTELYTYFRVTVTANNGDATFLEVGEFELLA